MTPLDASLSIKYEIAPDRNRKILYRCSRRFEAGCVPDAGGISHRRCAAYDAGQPLPRNDHSTFNQDSADVGSG